MKRKEEKSCFQNFHKTVKTKWPNWLLYTIRGQILWQTWLLSTIIHNGGRTQKNSNQKDFSTKSKQKSKLWPRTCEINLVCIAYYIILVLQIPDLLSAEMFEQSKIPDWSLKKYSEGKNRQITLIGVCIWRIFLVSLLKFMCPSFNSREILDFLKFETEHFWIEINSVLGHIKIVTFDCTWFDVFIKFSTPNTDKLIPFFVNLTLIIACILTHFSGFFDCTCTWFDDFLKFSNPRGHFTPNSDNLIPFSVGKRFCLGKDLAEQEFYLFLTGLLHRQIYISQVL